MALIKTFNFKGFEPNYWTITSIQDDKISNTTKVFLSLYKDKTTRLSTPPATIATVQFTLDGVDQTRAAIYPILKTKNPDNMGETPELFFANATDDTD